MNMDIFLVCKDMNTSLVLVNTGIKVILNELRHQMDKVS